MTIQSAGEDGGCRRRPPLLLRSCRGMCFLVFCRLPLAAMYSPVIHNLAPPPSMMFMPKSRRMGPCHQRHVVMLSEAVARDTPLPRKTNTPQCLRALEDTAGNDSSSAQKCKGKKYAQNLFDTDNSDDLDAPRRKFVKKAPTGTVGLNSNLTIPPHCGHTTDSIIRQ
jgi:hypothetical protein